MCRRGQSSFIVHSSHYLFMSRKFLRDASDKYVCLLILEASVGVNFSPPDGQTCTVQTEVTWYEKEKEHMLQK